MKTVAIFFGGKSNEHEISVITGMLAVNLLRDRYDVLPVYLAQDGGMYASREMREIGDFRDFDAKKFPAAAFGEKALVLAKKRKKKIAEPVAALNCCHGGAGEDGTLSALLRWHGIPCASPDLAVSSAFMSKELGKIAAKGLGIPVVESFAAGESDPMEEILARAEALGYPLIVKPSRLGSSIGIKVAADGRELKEALALAFRLDDGALVEKYLPRKRDINCAAYRKDGEVVLSECEEVFSDDQILSFSEKYEGTGKRNSQIPADLPEEITGQIRDCVKRIYQSFHVRGVVRADFLVSEGQLYFNELNTVPGSLACYLFGESLTQARDLLVSLVEEAKPEPQKNFVRTGILSAPVFTGAKGCKRR